MTVAISPQAVLSESTTGPVRRQGLLGQSPSGRLVRTEPALLFVAPTHGTQEGYRRGEFPSNIMLLRFIAFRWYPYFVHCGAVHAHFFICLL